MGGMFRGLLFLLSLSVCFGRSNMPPEADQKSCREIYKEMVEIKVGLHHRGDDAGGGGSGETAAGGRFSGARYFCRRS